MACPDEGADPLDCDVGSDHEEARADEPLRSPLGQRRRSPAGSKPPKQRKRRERLHERIRPEPDESNRAGNDPGTDGDPHFNRVPSQPEPRQEFRATDQGPAITRVVKAQRDGGRFHRRRRVTRLIAERVLGQ